MKPDFALKEIKIEVTQKCPLVCIHCSSDATPTAQLEMSFNDCLSIVRQSICIGVDEIVFSGGEPLLWDGLTKVINEASYAGKEVTVYTSGNVDDFLTKLLNLKKAGLKRIVFSIFGESSNMHENITRIRGSFKGTLNAAKIAVDNGLRTEFHFVPLKINYRELNGIYKLAKEIGVPRISILRFVPQGRGDNIRKYTLNKVQNLELKQTIAKLSENGFDIRTGSPYNFLLINENPQCNAAQDRLIVGPDLRIYPCDAFKQIKAEELVGTLDYSTLKAYTLLQCWENSPYLEAVRESQNTGFVEPCQTCTFLDKCLSGCLAQKVIMFGGIIKKPDPNCMREER